MAGKKNKKPNRKIVAEFDAYFGNTNSIENWQRLCCDVGIGENFPSITKCRKVPIPTLAPSS